LASVVFLWLVFWFAAPKDIDPWPALGFLFLAVAAPAVEAVWRASDREASRGLIAAVGAYTLFVLVATYSSVYYNTADGRNWSVHLSHVDALLLSMGTLTTAGTGDITPRSELARGLLSIQMAIDLGVVTIMVAVVLNRLANR